MPLPLTPEAKKAKQRLARNNYLLRTYGIDLQKYEEMLESQGGRCQICLCKPRTRVLAVDHDHFTGKIRGLLIPHAADAIMDYCNLPKRTSPS